MSNGWLAQRLEMGSPFYVSKHVGITRRTYGTLAHKSDARIKVKGKT